MDVVQVGAVLLAAGGGSRFAGPAHKLLTPARGKPLVVHALENMTAAHLTPCAVVTGAVDLDPLVPAGVAIVPNPLWADGQAASLQAAIGWADALGLDAVVVGLGDQPAVPPAAWRAVAAAPDVAIAVATYSGRRGNPVRLSRSVWGRLPRSGDAGARMVMAESPELVLEVACDGDPSDVDTVEDLARWS